MAALRKAMKLGDLPTVDDEAEELPGPGELRPNVWANLSKYDSKRKKKKNQKPSENKDEQSNDSNAEDVDALTFDNVLVDDNEEGSPSSQRRPPKSNKKANRRRKVQPQEGSDADGELDELLAAYSTASSPKADVIDDAVASPEKRLLQLLECSREHLDADNETRSKFGHAATLLDDQGSRYGSKQRSQRRFRKSMFVTVDQGWPPWTDHDLTLEVVKDVVPTTYVYRYGAEQRRAQAAFEGVAASHDPDLLYPVLQKFPYHVPTLLQLSLVLEMHDHLQQSLDLLRRAVYTLELVANKAGFPWLNPSKERVLPYSYPENQPVHEALRRHLHALSRAGNHRTALEVCKILYSLDADRDPMHCLLIWDYLCIRAAQWDYLQRFVCALERCGNGLNELPGMQYGHALALYLQEVAVSGEKVADGYCGDGCHPESLGVLRQAVLTHPMLVTVLLQKLEVYDADVLTHTVFAEAPETSTFRTLFEIYADRNAELWKRRDITAWLQSAVRGALQELKEDVLLATRLKVNRKAIHQRPCFQRYASATSEACLGRVIRLPEEELEQLRPVHRDPMRRFVWVPRNPVLLFLASFLPWNTLTAMLHQQIADAG